MGGAGEGVQTRAEAASAQAGKWKGEVAAEGEEAAEEAGRRDEARRCIPPEGVRRCIPLEGVMAFAICGRSGGGDGGESV